MKEVFYAKSAKKLQGESKLTRREYAGCVHFQNYKSVIFVIAM